MATAFAAMNDVYGPLYGVSRAEAASIDVAAQRAQAMEKQFVMDVHTHFLRDDTRLVNFVARARRSARPAGIPASPASAQTIDDLKYAELV